MSRWTPPARAAGAASTVQRPRRRSSPAVPGARRAARRDVVAAPARARGPSQRRRAPDLDAPDVTEARAVPPALPSPARAEPHDETSWLPLPEIEDLPDITDLLSPDTNLDVPTARELRPRSRRRRAPSRTTRRRGCRCPRSRTSPTSPSWSTPTGRPTPHPPGVGTDADRPASGPAACSRWRSPPSSSPAAPT